MHLEADTLLPMGLGAIILLVAWLPLVLNKLPLSLPIICVLIGIGLHSSGVLPLDLDRLDDDHVPERLNQAVVLISLMGAGLRLDRRFGWRRWGSTWRLLGVAMPLTILGVTLGAHLWLGSSWAASLLLGAALSPTDPVLASDVQTGPPGQGEQGEVRFALTSEAGLNDGLAFPFVTLAVLLAQPAPVAWGRWLGLDLVSEMGLGVLIGWLGGRAMGWFMFHSPRLKLSDTGDGLAAVGVTLIAYATAEILGANGFVTVFVTGASIRASEPDAEFHRAMSGFAEQVERVLVMLVLVLFGWSLGAGLLQPLTWRGVLLALALILVLRPASAWLGFLGTDLRWQPKALMAFFGIRGIGTLFYMQYAFARARFGDHDALWAVVAFTVLLSILLHGVTSTPLMRMAERRLRRRRREDPKEVR
ncbi:cation:proton antiporter [Roseomonas sp. E05]|uniref:cation:proton antiporter n=1 Tax=Roseomonas sp. E05 TaxID=3046310 RepID=UPI0024BA5BF8|nr:cation:proton antiporter [Roseomonas sp. E05]MDJ0390942.1 cation:proton antiporter [Roseomonas sp. E05]